MSDRTRSSKNKRKPAKELPERLKKKLIGELVLEFDKSFPIHLARITQIDERLNRILAELIFLNEDLERLPDHIREAITKEITGDDKELTSRLKALSERGSGLLEEWLGVAMDLAERRLRSIAEALKILDHFER